MVGTVALAPSATAAEVRKMGMKKAGRYSFHGHLTLTYHYDCQHCMIAALTTVTSYNGLFTLTHH